MSAFDQDKAALQSYGYKLVTVAEFHAATDVPVGNTREIVRRFLAKFGGTFVVYDPNDDDTGWLLVGDDAASLARQTVEHCLENEPQPAAVPAQPSLF